MTWSKQQFPIYAMAFGLLLSLLAFLPSWFYVSLEADLTFYGEERVLATGRAGATNTFGDPLSIV